MKINSILSDLIITFAKIGLFTFGGGYAMISLIDRECVDKKKWLTHDELLNITVIAESTPGPIAINCATYVGYQQAGFLGAVLATLGIVLPSFSVIYLVSLFFDNFLENSIVANAFRGIEVAVSFLICNVALKMFLQMPKKKIPIAIMLSSFSIMLITNFMKLPISSVYIILVAGCIGLATYAFNPKRRGGRR